MHILDIDPDDNPRTINPQSSGRVTRNNSSDRSDCVSRGFMRDVSGFSRAPDVSGRSIVRAANDNQEPEYSAGRSLLKRIIVAAYCWGLLPVSTAQHAINRLRIWEA